MRIIGPPSVEVSDTFLSPVIGPPAAVPLNVLFERIPAGAHARFYAEMCGPLWDAAVRHGIDPVGVIAQAGKETAWGNYTGQVPPGFHNTCGLKKGTSDFPGKDDGDKPFAHADFGSFEVGALAHVQHLCAYTGWPVTGLIVDPRYRLVNPVPRLRCENWADLGGKWAPSATYGLEIEATMRTLQGFA
jgi:N-acetylmuramoyl-L-alanine amidase